MASEIQIYAIGTCAIGILANRPNAQEFTSPRTPPMEKTTKSLTYFMQIKANFRKAQMNVNSLITKDYRKNDAFAVQKNKPNSNPIQSQSKPILERMNVNFCATGYYESKPTFAVRKGRPNNPNVEITTAWSCGARIVA